jgi:hypothetical protein
MSVETSAGVCDGMKVFAFGTWTSLVKAEELGRAEPAAAKR